MSPLHKYRLIVSCGGLGLIKPAPGTWGSALGVMFSYCLMSLLSSHLIIVGILVLLSLFAWWSIFHYERLSHTHDESLVVIDEFVAQSWVFAFAPITPWSLAIGFLLFRFFDILKPYPISKVDQEWTSAFGTLFDDLLAAGAAWLCLQGILVGFKFWF